MQKNAIADRFHLILASKSPRRRQLLRDAGFEFTLADSFEVEEIYPETLAAEEVAEFLSNLKADAYPVALKGNDVLITSDTVVVADGEVMGKPADYDDAFRMLRKLSGRMHKVITAVCIRTVSQKLSFSDECDVFFDELSDEEIDFYLRHYKPYDKAGAYGIQEWIGYVGISRIEGSFFTVMGFPIHRVYQELKRLE
ncbi:Maf family nucleotide pyrophosphatase [Acetobacteroides hydrogenigenes]|uniref:dTTP/UTP pyrophosphatase n=1 Tax=Acetobacteroides hydrogenigenes TaxID=979970 RepID=A0A4R2EM58_9BACT|nr:Maf family nucleotide pyrophosphatase [Acetobacteroides hydrogenigenes]TCN67544.1 septum formation protein [Acetobacteroides hydrogenigenes]